MSRAFDEGQDERRLIAAAVELATSCMAPAPDLEARWALVQLLQRMQVNGHGPGVRVTVAKMFGAVIMSHTLAVVSAVRNKEAPPLPLVIGIADGVELTCTTHPDVRYNLNTGVCYDTGEELPPPVHGESYNVTQLILNKMRQAIP